MVQEVLKSNDKAELYCLKKISSTKAIKEVIAKKYFVEDKLAGAKTGFDSLVEAEAKYEEISNKS